MTEHCRSIAPILTALQQERTAFAGSQPGRRALSRRLYVRCSTYPLVIREILVHVVADVGMHQPPFPVGAAPTNLQQTQGGADYVLARSKTASRFIELQRDTVYPMTRTLTLSNNGKSNSDMPVDMPDETPAEADPGAAGLASSAPELAQLADSEAKMRQALGMLGRSSGGGSKAASPVRRGFEPPAAGTRRHRFVQDGEVPVTVVHGRSDHGNGGKPVASASHERIESLQSALAHEQGVRQRAEALHREAVATIRDLHTKLVHIELTRDEAIARADKMTAEKLAAEKLLAERPFVERPITETRKPAMPEVPRRPAIVAAEPQAATVIPVPAVKRGRKPGPRAEAAPKRDSQQPVKWWLTSKAKKMPGTSRRRTV